MPDFCEKLKSMHPDLGIWLDYFVILATVFIYYYSFWSPLKLFESQARKKWEVMKYMATNLDDDYGRKFNFNFTIMLVQTSFCYYIEPVKENLVLAWLSRKRRRFSLYGKILKVIWHHGIYCAPLNFRMTINQGFCGWAFREGNETSWGNIKGGILRQEIADADSTRLNDEQRKLNEAVVIAASCPLVLIDKDVNGLKKKVIGVLNVESRSPASEELLLDASKKYKFYERVVALSRIYINLHS